MVIYCTVTDKISIFVLLARALNGSYMNFGLCEYACMNIIQCCTDTVYNASEFIGYGQDIHPSEWV